MSALCHPSKESSLTIFVSQVCEEWMHVDMLEVGVDTSEAAAYLGRGLVETV